MTSCITLAVRGHISDSTAGWTLSQVSRGPPYHVALVGPYEFIQVEDARGTSALSGPNGAVFCATTEQAAALCAAANAGLLEAA